MLALSRMLSCGLPTLLFKRGLPVSVRALGHGAMQAVTSLLSETGQDAVFLEQKEHAEYSC